MPSEHPKFLAETGRYVGASSGTLVALWLGQWPSDAMAAALAIGGGTAGLLAVLAVQKAWAVFSDKGALKLTIRQQAEKIENREQQIELYKKKAEEDRKEIIVTKVTLEAWSRAYSDAVTTGNLAPVPVILKRIENNLVGKL